VQAITKTILMNDAEVVFYSALFAQEVSKRLFVELHDSINWKHEPIKLFGKYILQPRLTAYYGDKPYTYSGITMQPLPWNNALLEIKSIIEPLAGVNFNAVLINLYRGGNDSIGWHSDDERDMAQGSVIGSVSLGATRRFIFRRRDNHKIKVEFNLAQGDFLIMSGKTQQYWQHQVPKSSKITESRINLTFRVII
jgi:alkylated DNA repair dioxygenase AlkB